MPVTATTPLFTCWLPHPTAALGSNKMLGRHGQTKGKAHSQYLRDCLLTLREQFGWFPPAPVTEPVAVRLVEETGYFYQGLDFDNLIAASKKAIDALVEWGVLPDDGRRWVRMVSAEHDIEHDDLRLRVELWPANAVRWGQEAGA